MKTTLIRFTLPLLLALTLTSRLSAHFMFVHIVHGSAPRIELHFAESAWDFSVNSGMVDILERVKATLPDGSALEFERRPFGFVAKLQPNQVTAAASLTYGMIGRGGAPFLLEYYAKGAISLKNAATATGLGAEILAEETSPGRTTLTVLFRGAPAPGAEVVVPLEGTYTEKRTTDAAGKLVIPTPTAPLFSIRAMVAEEREGEHDGKPFSLAKHYTTLTVHPDNVPSNCDGVAWAVLQDAAHCCAAFLPAEKQWNASFRLSGAKAPASGSLKGSARDVRLTDASAEMTPALSAQVQMLTCFRNPAVTGGHAVVFAADRKATGEAYIDVPGLQLSYVIRDRQIEVVEQAGDAISKRVDVTGWKMTHDERMLPASLVVTHFNDAKEIVSTTMMKRTYKESEKGWVMDRQDCCAVTGLGVAARTSLRFSDVEVSDATTR